MHAVSRAVEEYLEHYRQRVAALEQDYLREPTLPLSHVRVSIEPDRQVLQTLHLLARRLQQAGAALVESPARFVT